MKFSIVIPNYNGANFISDCLKSLQIALIGFDYEIIIVDNNSTDNSLILAKKILPNFRVILNKKNLGFAAAVNQGIMSAKYEYVVLVNNDIVVDNNWFKYLSKTIDYHKHAVTFCGAVLNKTGTHYESLGLKYFIRGKCLNIKNKRRFLPKTHKKLITTQIWGSSAAIVIYKKEIIQKIGLFDSNYFAYEEDVDLALRLHNLGFITMLNPQAISYHIGGATSSKMGNFRNQMDTKNWFYIIIKNYSLKNIILNFIPITIERLRNLSGLIKSSSFPKIFCDIFYVYSQVLSNIPNMIKKRQQIKKIAKL